MAGFGGPLRLPSPIDSAYHGLKLCIFKKNSWTACNEVFAVISFTKRTQHKKGHEITLKQFSTAGRQRTTQKTA